MFNVPILFVVFNRLDTTQKVFSQIRKIQPKQLFVAADGPRAEKPKEIDKCNEVRNYIMQNIDWDCDVKTRFLEKNAGCKYAVSGALKWFFSFVEAGIILEDDCFPDLSFFPYCEELLEKYKDNPKIRMISGRNNITEYYPKKQSYYFTTCASIWGWATWKREVDDFDVDVRFPKEQEVYKQHFEFSKDHEEAKVHALQSQHSSASDYTSWGYPWDIQGKLEKKIGILPAVNLINNLGIVTGGTHTSGMKSDFAEIRTMQFPLHHPETIEIDYNLSLKHTHAHLFLPAHDKVSKNGLVIIKKLVKCILPYGVVRLIKKIKSR